MPAHCLSCPWRMRPVGESWSKHSKLLAYRFSMNCTIRLLLFPAEQAAVLALAISDDWSREGIEFFRNLAAQRSS